MNMVLHLDMPVASINKMLNLAKFVDQVNRLEPMMQSFSDEALRKKSGELREHVLDKSKIYEKQVRESEDMLTQAAMPEEKQRLRERIKLIRSRVFEEVMPEAFALVREASWRTIGLRHFDVQIAAGAVLHRGAIVEMATGEGKTLVATLPVYLNGLLGKGVHIITVNDYLAGRDTEWMGPIYEFLGLSLGVIQHDMSDEERKKAYNCDITYGTNNEFGFDYLRDNMKYQAESLVQRPFYFAIVDEVDSILIDEARTPLIISGPSEESTDKYYIVNKIIPRLKGRQILERDEVMAKYKGEDLSKGYDYIIDEKAHTAYLTEEGEKKVCPLLNIDDLHTITTMDWRHHIIAGLRAHNLFRADRDYVVRDGQVIIVDEFTGRLMPGRRWSDGLHQAIEAKEGLRIERENQTLATVTFQNYFRLYEKLAGMTGTAFTEAQEFKSIYKLDVVVIPTNRLLRRGNFSDCIYKTEREKFNAIVSEIVDLYNKGRPVLVGTISIEKSEYLSEVLKQHGVSHQVLNAKYHQMEAQIVAQAGRFKAVTIATNMAGRGTDIVLGGNPSYLAKNLLRQEKLSLDEPRYLQEYEKIFERFKKETDEEHRKVVALGGLHVIGTERHEARRIDNQLRGRAGRQGDPGSSRFYVSLKDDLMRLFGSERLIGIMDRLGLEEGQSIEHPWVTKSIEIAQRRVEQHNFEIRKQLLEYDNVMNRQREVIYAQRKEVLKEVSLKEEVDSILEITLENLIARYLIAESASQEQVQQLLNSIELKFSLSLNADDYSGLSRQTIKERLHHFLRDEYHRHQELIGYEKMQKLEQMVLLQIVDSKWKDHLYAMDDLREGIGLRAIGQRDPLLEYRREAQNYFEQMIGSIQEEAIEMLFRIRPSADEKMKAVFSSALGQFLHPYASHFEKPERTRPEPGPDHSIPQKTHPKVGRNEPCPCGSGKKYKHCHGR